MEKIRKDDINDIHQISRMQYPRDFFQDFISWLVVWNMFDLSIQLGIMIPTDELIFFRGVGR
jgi:hypothetical protein